jgi:hypothetical protein
MYLLLTPAQSLPVQARLFKSLKLWSFYVDLEESLGTVEATTAVYDKILELKIANAQIIVNYVEENKYFEESFKVYERGVELFTFPVSNISETVTASLKADAIGRASRTCCNEHFARETPAILLIRPRSDADKAQSNGDPRIG